MQREEYILEQSVYRVYRKIQMVNNEAAAQARYYKAIRSKR